MINQIKKIAAKNKIFERIIYIAYRFCAFFYSALFLLCRIFPIKDNKIVCCNMKGKRYGDNPKYIIDEIIRQGLDYELVWLIKDKKKDVGDVPKEIHLASYNPLSIAYHLSTAKVWIDTNMKAVGTLKRKNQYYIQTWHGSYGLKKIACDIKGGQSLIDTALAIYNAKIEDLMISNSCKTTEIYRTAFRFNGRILESGSPRNDIFFENPQKYQDKVYKYFGIQNKKVLLYAPTFRDDFSLKNVRLDFDKVRSVLSRRFGGNWVILVRLHPNNIRDAKEFINYSDTIINATDYSIMQELLMVCDALITDYSSCMFDFATSRKPCFLFTPDLEKYQSERDFYFDIMSLPFPVASDMEELIKNVKDFNKLEYDDKLQKLFNQVGLCDDGTACEKIVSYIKQLK